MLERELLLKYCSSTHFCAEILKWVSLDSVDAENRVWLNCREATRHCGDVLLAADLTVSPLNPCPCSFPHEVPLPSFYSKCTHTEELLAAAGLLNNLNKTWLQLLDRRNVVGEDTHLSRLGWKVDLYAVAHKLVLRSFSSKFLL